MKRILWITWGVFEPVYNFVKGRPEKNSSWTTPLFLSMCKQHNIQLASVTPVINGAFQKKNVDNVLYYSVPIKSGDNLIQLNKTLIKNYKLAIDDFKPDLIHIHGVEVNFGLLRKHVDNKIPIVCSIQGLINPYYLFLKYSVATIKLNRYRSLKNLLGRGGLKGTLKRWEKYMDIEREILQINQYFIGRTLWDKAQVAAFNPNAHYFHGEELLRKPFYTNKWNIKDCTRFRVLISSAAYSLKGFHILLKAAAILKDKYPNIQIVSPLSDFKLKSSLLRKYLIAEDYSNFLRREIIKLNLKDNVILLPKLNADEMALEFKKAHVFVLASFGENSPNALGEAMMIGTPSVVSPVGGVMSMVKDEESALFFSTGDYNMLAYQIKRILKEDKLALKLSENANIIALRRHDLKITTNQYLDIYKEIIKLHN